MTAPLAPTVYVDTETTGLARLGPDAAEIWDFAAKRRDPDGTVRIWQAYVLHDLDKAKQLPAEFFADHETRYQPATALDLDAFRDLILEVFAAPTGTPYRLKPHVIGAVPDFDMTIIERTIGIHGNDVPWHHHIQDVETLAAGYLNGYHAAMRHLGANPLHQPPQGPPWDSDALSLAVGVDPTKFARHTALGDILWAEAIHDAVMGATP